MIYTLPYQTEELLKNSYYRLRNIINLKSDIIHLTVTHCHLQDYTKEELYKKILLLDGKYRTDTNNWTSPALRLRVIDQL
jgi:hypothetical protein